MNGQFNQEIVRNRLPQLALTAFGFLGTSACDGDTVTIIDPGPSGPQTASPSGDSGSGSVGEGSAGEGGAGEGGAAESSTVGSGGTGSADEGPLYIVNTTISSPDGRLSYFIATSSIDDGVEIDVRSGLEIPGTSRAYPVPGAKNTFMASGGESPTLTRYEVLEDGSIAQGDSVSFANFGVENPNGQMYFVSATKAYIIAYSQNLLVSFNPESMEILKATPFGDGGCNAHAGRLVPRDGGFYFPLICDWDETPPTDGSLLFINSDTDEISSSTY